MSDRLCAPCGIGEHGLCAGNYDVYIGGFGAPAVRGRCACPCCSQEVRGVCDRCGSPCSPETAADHRTCPLRLDPTLDAPTEATR
ncbi:hypothetical protein AB0909_00950 [Streptomyces albidoflavus]|uniref:hypothetical protein n=1 Tax=Streptomyces albidoflavus TaxID=1886 RepID=UPI0007431F6F|nr:hypothetical protein [Streptomyces albidoflavus]KUL59702.1 hypothetical protein ADL32_19235 [Streptomyces albidoflavus]